MSASAEKLGLKLLRALKREKESGKTLLNCRRVSVIAAQIGLTESERDQAERFLVGKQAINAVRRSDGMAVLTVRARRDFACVEKTGIHMDNGQET